MDLQAVGARDEAGGRGRGAPLRAGLQRGAHLHRVAPGVVQPGVRAGAGQEGAAALRVDAVEPLQLPQTRAAALRAARVAAVAIVAAVAAVLRHCVIAARHPRVGEERHLLIYRGVLLMVQPDW